jgi:hypothetical protein
MQIIRESDRADLAQTVKIRFQKILLWTGMLTTRGHGFPFNQNIFTLDEGHAIAR